MPTSFPGGFDTFNEPTIPEETTLSSAGTGSRNHTEHHRDMGDAIEAIEHNVALKGHDHSGGTDDFDTPKLDAANTHENSDVDSSLTSLHHTLGTGAHQAAAGDHAHEYSDILHTPFRACTSTTRPGYPTLGLMIYELDTYRLRVWAQYPGDTAPSWRFLLGPLPNVRLRQAAAQKLSYSGSILEWREEIEDSSNSFDATVSLTNITIREKGLYQVECALQWDPSVVPDTAHAVFCINGVETTVRQSQYLRGNVFQPGFSQTLTVVGKLRLAVNDTVTVKASYSAPSNLLELIFSFFDAPSKVNSRLDIAYLGP